MVITKDIYNLSLLKPGMPEHDFLRNSSSTYLEELKKWNLVSIDRHRKLFLTDRGQVAKKIGVQKYIEIELFEKELTREEPRKLQDRDRVLLGIISFLNFILIAVLVYICLRAPVN